MNKNIEVGSKVFVYSCGALKEHEVVSFGITECGGELVCEVRTKMGKNKDPQKFFLNGCIEGIKAAQDMKISEIIE